MAPWLTRLTEGLMRKDFTKQTIYLNTKRLQEGMTRKPTKLKNPKNSKRLLGGMTQKKTIKLRKSPPKKLKTPPRRDEKKTLLN